MDWTQIVVALIGLVGVSIPAYLAYVRGVRARQLEIDLKQAELEMKFQSVALRFTSYALEWSETETMITQAIEDNNFDRFLILRAWNGQNSPRWVTAVHQIREVGQIPYQYIHVELDHDYVSKLIETVDVGMVRYKVDEMPKSLIRDIYIDEGVTEAVWCHLSAYQLNTGDGKAIEFVSFATHEPDGFKETDMIKVRLLLGRLKGLAMSFAGSPELDVRETY